MKVDERTNIITIAPDEFDEIVFDILEDLGNRFADSELPEGIATAVRSIVIKSYNVMYDRLYGGREDYFAD